MKQAVEDKTELQSQRRKSIIVFKKTKGSRTITKNKK